MHSPTNRIEMIGHEKSDIEFYDLRYLFCLNGIFVCAFVAYKYKIERGPRAESRRRKIKENI